MDIKKLIGTALAGVISILAPLTAAEATSITTHYDGAATFNGSAVWYETGWIAPNPNSSTTSANVYIGGDTQHITSSGVPPFPLTGSINTWCVDIYHWAATNSVYNVETGYDLAAKLDGLRPSSTSGVDGETRVGQLITLANEVYAGLSTTADSAAFQLAVWEITYGTINSTLGYYQINGTDLGFNLDSTTLGASYTARANYWLKNLGLAPSTGNYLLTYLDDGTAENTQDMAVFTAAPPLSMNGLTSVPEPNSIALLVTGLIGFVVTRRKKNHVQTNLNQYYTKTANV